MIGKKRLEPEGVARGRWEREREEAGKTEIVLESWTRGSSKYSSTNDEESGHSEERKALMGGRRRGH